MTTPPPPPPNYAPTAGLVTTWWSNTAAAVWTPENIAAADRAQQRTVETLDRISQTLTETPEERVARERRERADRDAAYVAEGKTAKERAARQREVSKLRRDEDLQRQRRAERRASMLHKVDHSERTRRVRRWFVLTGLSASAGYSVGLVQWAGAQGIGAYVVLAASWALDLWMRRDKHGRLTRVSEVRGAIRLPVLVLVRVPVASALAAACKLGPLLALTGPLFDHLINAVFNHR